jgi:outer membrane biosynthesis protein TonB
MTKGDPALEAISLKTLKKWKFNRLDSDQQMQGMITFTFKPN